jgi:hypothetical protein
MFVQAAPPCGVWSQSATGTPSARFNSAAIYDPVRARTILFGGNGAGGPDLWQHYVATGWSALSASGTPPSSYANAQAIYDPVGDRMLLLVPGVSVWSLSLGATPAWSALATTGTAPGNIGTCVYDSAHERILNLRDGNIWALDLSLPTPAWSILIASPIVNESSMIYDSSRDRLVIWENFYPGTSPVLRELTLSGTPTWNVLALAGGPADPSRDFERAVYDPLRDRMIMVGGESEPYSGTADHNTWAILFRDRSYFIDLTGTVGSPGDHEYHCLVFDSVDDELLMHGGVTGTYFGSTYHQTYRLPFGNRAETFAFPTNGGYVTRNTNHPCDSLTTVTFTAVPTTNYAFSHWSGDASGSTNPVSVLMDGHKLIIANFEYVPPDLGDAGINLSWDDCGTHGASLATFACNTNSGAPLAVVASFRPPAGIVQFNGQAAALSVQGSGALPDWWKHGPGLCKGTGLIVSEFVLGGASCPDPYQGQAVGGYNANLHPQDPNRLMVLVQSAVPGPYGPLDPDVEYFAFRILFSRAKTVGTGSCSGCTVPVTITLDSIQVYQPQAVDFSPSIHSAIMRKKVYWQALPASVDPRPGVILALLGANWDRDGGGGSVALTLPQGGAATLDLLDIAGRKWASRVLSGLVAGRHEVRLESSPRLPPGVYFLRLTQGEESANRKLVFAH